VIVIAKLCKLINYILLVFAVSLFNTTMNEYLNDELYNDIDMIVRFTEFNFIPPIQLYNLEGRLSKLNENVDRLNNR